MVYSGLHDNGYTTTLSHLQTEGLLDKLIFLRGYNEIAFQLRDYEIPECTIPGVFMTQKMPVKLNSRRFAAGFSQAHPSPSFRPQSNLTLPQFQHTPSFTPPQSSPPFSPQMRITSPFQLMSEPASPAYAPQTMPPPSPPPYLDPTVVRTFFQSPNPDLTIVACGDSIATSQTKAASMQLLLFVQV